jgi:hypothetical protein
LSAALLLAAALLAADPVTPPPPPPSESQVFVCADDAARQFDFLLGDWTVTASGSNDVLSKVKVTRVADGCGLLESVTPVRGVGAESLVTYDTGATLWHWDQVSGDGSILSLQGGLQNGEMVMEGDESGASKHMLVRITWAANGDSIHEAAERSPDGRVWNAWFERDFRRAAPTNAAATPAAVITKP